MATLGDLKKRIISETLRDDLADTMASDLTSIIQQSITYYANEPWSFNEFTTSTLCTVGAQTTPLPLDFRLLQGLWLMVGGVRYLMSERQDIEIISLYATPIQGQPTEFAVVDTTIHMWPTPNQPYPLLWNYIRDVSPPLVYTDDTSANAWTNQGQDLITAQAKLRLYRDYLSAGAQDPRIQNASLQEDQAYSRLRAESVRRMSTGRVLASW